MNYCKYPFENDKNGLEPDICESGNWESPNEMAYSKYFRGIHMNRVV